MLGSLSLIWSKRSLRRVRYSNIYRIEPEAKLETPEGTNFKSKPIEKPVNKESIEEEFLSQAFSQPPTKPEHQETPTDPEFHDEEVAPGIGDETPPDTNL